MTQKRHGQTEPVLTLTTRYSYAALLIPISMLHTPALSMLPALYAKHSAVSLSTIGLILILTRLLDAVTDPLIGILSDRTQSRLGSRKPWIIVGTVIACVGCYFWFRPGADTGWVYFLISSVLVYLGWTLIEVPHSAWLCELSRDYAQRSRLSGNRVAANFIGWALFLSLPLWPIFDTTEMTPQVTALASWIVILTLPPLVILAIMRTPAGTHVTDKRPEILASIQAVAKNGVFHFFISSMLASMTASGMVATLYFFFLDKYLHILDRIAHIGLMAALISIGAALFWGKAVVRLGKHRVMAVGAFMNALVLWGMFLLPPGEWAFAGMLVLFGLSALFWAGTEVASYALLADIVDYDTMKTYRNHAGNYYAVHALVKKLGLALGGGFGLLLVSQFGFSAKGDNDAFAMGGFFLAFIFIPMGLNIIAGIIAWLFPLDRKRHDIVLRRLASRDGLKKTY